MKMFIYIYILQVLAYYSVLKLSSSQQEVNGIGNNVLSITSNGTNLQYDISNRWNVNGEASSAYRKSKWNVFRFFGPKSEVPEQVLMTRLKRSVSNRVKRDVDGDSTIDHGEPTTSIHDLDQSAHSTLIPIPRSEQSNLVTDATTLNSTLLTQYAMDQNLQNTRNTISGEVDVISEHTTLAEGDNSADYTSWTPERTTPERTTMITGIINLDVSTLAPNAITSIGTVASDFNLPSSEHPNLNSNIISSGSATIAPVIREYLNTGDFNSENIYLSQNVIGSGEIASSGNAHTTEQTTVAVASTEPKTTASTFASPAHTFISTEVYRSLHIDMAQSGVNAESTSLAPALLDSVPTTLSQGGILSEHTTTDILNPDLLKTIAQIEMSLVGHSTFSPDTAVSVQTNIAELMGSLQTSLTANDVASEPTTRPSASAENSSLLTQDVHSSENYSTRTPTFVTIEESTTLATDLIVLNNSSLAHDLVSPAHKEITDLHIATDEHVTLSPAVLMSAEQTSSARDELSSEEYTTLAPSHTLLGADIATILNQIVTFSTAMIPAQTTTTDDVINSIENTAISPGVYRLHNPESYVARIGTDDDTLTTSLFVSIPIGYTDMTTQAFDLERLTTFVQVDVRSVDHTATVPEFVSIDSYNSVAPSVTDIFEITTLGQDVLSPLRHTDLALEVTSPPYQTTMFQDATSSLHHRTLPQDLTSSVYHIAQALEITSSIHDTTRAQDVTSSIHETTMAQALTSSVHDLTRAHVETSSIHETTRAQALTSSVYHETQTLEITSSIHGTNKAQDVTSSEQVTLQTDLLSVETEVMNANFITLSSEMPASVTLHRVSTEHMTMPSVQTFFTNTTTVSPSANWSAEINVQISNSTPIVDHETNFGLLNALLSTTSDSDIESAFQNASVFQELTSASFELDGTSTVLLPSTFDVQNVVLETSEHCATTSLLFSGEMLQSTPTYVSTSAQNLENLISRTRQINTTSTSVSMHDQLTTSPIIISSISSDAMIPTSNRGLGKVTSSYGILQSSSQITSQSLQDFTRSTFLSGTEAFANLDLSSLVESYATNLPIDLTTSIAADSFTSALSSELKTSTYSSTPISKALESTSRSSGIRHSISPSKTITTFRTSILPHVYVTTYLASSSLTVSATPSITKKVSPSSTQRQPPPSMVAPTHIVITTAPSLRNVTIEFFYESDCEVVVMSPYKEELVIKFYRFFYELMKINAKSISIGSPQCSPQHIVVSFRDVGRSALLASLRESGVTPFTLGPAQNRIWFNVTEFREVVSREEKTSDVGDIVLIIVALCICVTLVSAGVIIFLKEIYLKRGRRNIQATMETPTLAKKSTGESKSEKYISGEMTEARSADESYCSPYDVEYSSIGNGEFTSFTTSGSCGSTPARQENERSSSTATRPTSKQQLKKPKRKSNSSKNSGKYGLVVGLLGYKKPQARPDAEDCHLYAVPGKNDLTTQQDYPEDHCYVNSPNPFREPGSNKSPMRSPGQLKETLGVNSSREHLVAAGPEPNVYNNCVYNAAFLSEQDPVTSSSFDSVHF